MILSIPFRVKYSELIGVNPSQCFQYDCQQSLITLPKFDVNVTNYDRSDRSDRRRYSYVVVVLRKLDFIKSLPYIPWTWWDQVLTMMIDVNKSMTQCVLKNSEFKEVDANRIAMRIFRWLDLIWHLSSYDYEDIPKGLASQISHFQYRFKDL